MDIFLFLWLGCAVLCWVVANAKGRIAGLWFVLGLVFPVIALLALAALPSLARDRDAPSPSTHVKCPDCRTLIPKDARVCAHCRCRLVPQ